MSPDRGHPLVYPLIDRGESRKSVGRSDSGYDAYPEDTNGVVGADNTNPPTENAVAENNVRQSVEQQRIFHDKPLCHKPESLKSVSSTPSSRRDSAVSASSRERRRPRASRADSKQSLKSAREGSSGKASSVSSRQRPRRAMSSPYIQPTRPNIEEALALHERSCRILDTVSRPTTSYNPQANGYPLGYSLYQSATSASALPKRQYQESIRSCAQPTETVGRDSVEDEPQQPEFVPATIIHWTSDETRRREYEKIDKANSGMRGLLKKLFPWVSKSSRSHFYDEKEGSDAGSIRRYRLDISDEREAVH